MTAAAPDRGRGVTMRSVVWIVAALVFAYVTFQAVGNLLGVTNLIDGYNDIVRGSAVDERTTPWALLVADLLIAPVGFVVAFLVTRRMDAGRTAFVFLTALCAVSALWFTLSQFVQPYTSL